MRNLSPRKRVPLDLINEEESKSSPTRVMDFDSEKSPTLSPQKEHVEPNDATDSSTIEPTVHEQLAPPDIAVTPTNRRSRQHRERASTYKSHLATLDETTSSEELQELRPFDEPVPAMTNPSPSRKPKKGYGPTASNSEPSGSERAPECAPPEQSKSPARKAAVSIPQTPLQQIERIRDDAADFAKKGEEDRAIALYKKALKIAATEMRRIKGQIQQANGLHPSTLESVLSRLNEDWHRIGTTIATIRTVMAILYERLGDYNRAIACCKEATAVYKGHVEHDKDDSGAKAGLQTMNFMVEKMKSAQSSYDERRRIHSEIIVLRKKIAVANSNQEKTLLYAKVEQLANDVRTVELETLGERHPQVADTCALLSTLALEQDNRPLALKRMREALAIDEVSLGFKHPRTGHDLVRIGRIFSGRSAEEDEKAMSHFNMAIDVFRMAGNCAQAIGSCLNDIAVIHMKRREFDLAIQKLAEALDACQYASVNSEEMDVSSHAIQTWRNQGECYFLRRDFDLAANAYVNALDLQRRSRKIHDALANDETRDPRDIARPMFASDESIADTLCRLGKASAAQKKPHQALVAFKEAVVIQQAATDRAVKRSKGHISSDVPARQDELAHTLYCIAEVCSDMEEYEEAINLYSEAMQLRLFSDANKGENRSNMVHCAMSLVGIGNVHLKQHELKDAEKVYNDALAYCEAHGVPDSHAIVGMIKHKIADTKNLQAKTAAEIFQSDSASDVEDYAESELKEGHLEHAIRAFSYVMTLRKRKLKRLKEEGADSVQEKFDAACTLERFGYALSKQGDTDSAIKAYSDACRLFKKNGEHKRAETVETSLAALQQQ